MLAQNRCGIAIYIIRQGRFCAFINDFPGAEPMAKKVLFITLFQAQAMEKLTHSCSEYVSKGVLAETIDKASLANCRVTDYNHLEDSVWL